MRVYMYAKSIIYNALLFLLPIEREGLYEYNA